MFDVHSALVKFNDLLHAHYLPISLESHVSSQFASASLPNLTYDRRKKIE